MPTVLVESCFMTNNDDMRWLMDEGYETVADALFAAVQAWDAEFNKAEAPNLEEAASREVEVTKREACLALEEAAKHLHEAAKLIRQLSLS